jgi:hypothetical protein
MNTHISSQMSTGAVHVSAKQVSQDAGPNEYIIPGINDQTVDGQRCVNARKALHPSRRFGYAPHFP